MIKILLIVCCLATICAGYEQCLSPLVDITVNSVNYTANTVICDEEFVTYMWSLVIPSDDRVYGSKAVRGTSAGSFSSAGGYPTKSKISRIICLFIPTVVNGENSMEIIEIVTEFRTKADTPSCFPKHVLVPTTNGLKFISELKLDDELQIGPDEFVPMIGWLHRNSRAVSNFITLHSGDKSITMSPEHLLMVSNGCVAEFVPTFTRDVEMGDCVHTGSKTTTVITDITNSEMVGIYAPYMGLDYFYAINTYVTDPNVCPVWEDQYIMVSPYAKEWPNTPQSLVLMLIMKTYRLSATDDDHDVVDFIPSLVY